MADQPKPIIAIHPAVAKSRSARGHITRKLERAGYLVVFADTQHIRIMEVEMIPVARTDALAQLAFKVISENGTPAANGEGPKTRLGTMVSKMFSEESISAPHDEDAG